MSLINLTSKRQQCKTRRTLFFKMPSHRKTAKVNYAIEASRFSDVSLFPLSSFSRFSFDYATAKEIISTLPKLKQSKKRKKKGENISFYAKMCKERKWKWNMLILRHFENVLNLRNLMFRFTFNIVSVDNIFQFPFLAKITKKTSESRKVKTFFQSQIYFFFCFVFFFLFSGWKEKW